MRCGGMSMVRRQHIVRDYQAAGSVNSLLALWGFVDDQTFLTKAGHVGLVFRLAGVDAEGLDDAERQHVVHRFEAALRVLDEHCRVYQYLCKHRIDPIEAVVCQDPVVNDAIQQRVAFLNTHRDELYEIELYLVLVYEGTQKRRSSTRLHGLFRNPRRAIRQWLSAQTVFRLLDGDVDRAVAHLHQKAAAFEVQLADSVRPTRMGKADAFRFFRRLVNDTAAASGSPL